MKVSAITTILSFALAAAAMPSRNEPRGGEPTVGPGGNAICGNGQIISCCNTKSVSNGAGGLVGIGGALDGLLGGDCNPLTIPVVGIPVPVSQACAGNQAACCTGNESGLVNLACTNVNV